MWICFYVLACNPFEHTNRYVHAHGTLPHLMPETRVEWRKCLEMLYIRYLLNELCIAYWPYAPYADCKVVESRNRFVFIISHVLLNFNQCAFVTCCVRTSTRIYTLHLTTSLWPGSRRDSAPANEGAAVVRRRKLAMRRNSVREWVIIFCVFSAIFFF